MPRPPIDPTPPRDAAPPVSRRAALRALGSLLLGVPVVGARCAPAPEGDAEAGRAVGEGGGRSERRGPGLGPLGVQLYTLRDAMAGSVEATLARVAAIGYREVEFAGYFGRTPEQIRATLDAEGLTAPSTHLGVDAFDAWPATLDAATVMGHRWIVIPSLPREMRASLDDWRRTAERFDAAAGEARAAGIRVAFHNHAVDVRPLEGRVPLDVFLEETDPELVGVQADVHWLVAGGVDPVAFLDRWPGRIPSVHLKDRTGDGEMADVGAGAIDWPAVLAAARRAGVAHHFVEHDRPADPFASVRASFDYLDALRTG